MQRYNHHEIIAKTIGGKIIAASYYGLKLVWMAVRSCFGSGEWVKEKPWLGDEKWKSNK